MTAAESTTRSTVDAEVAVANLQYIGSCTATGALSAAVPAPTVFRDETSTAGAEGIVLTVALGDGRGIVDVGFAYLRPYRANE